MLKATFQRIIDNPPLLCRVTRRSPLFRRLQERKLNRWLRSGRPLPPPNVYKQVTVQEYAARYSLATLVETGTYYGAMVLAMQPHFNHIYSIELDPYLHARASYMFADQPQVTILRGDSAEVLPAVLNRISRPALFWLDAHYSGPGTARSSCDTPIVRELELILEHPVKEHVVLIDDAHDFGRLSHYPSVERVRTRVEALRPEWHLEVTDDIIRIHPPMDGAADPGACAPSLP